MYSLKYIMVDVDASPMPVIFTALVTHEEVARRLDRKVLSAGFVRLWTYGHDIKVDAYGESKSLNKKASPEDAEIIRREVNR